MHRGAIKAKLARHDSMPRDATEKNRDYVFKITDDAFGAAKQLTGH